MQIAIATLFSTVARLRYASDERAPIGALVSRSAGNALPSHPDILPIGDCGGIVAPACGYAWTTTEAVIRSLAWRGQADITGAAAYTDRSIGEALKETTLE